MGPGSAAQHSVVGPGLSVCGDSPRRLTPAGRPLPFFYIPFSTNALTTAAFFFLQVGERGLLAKMANAGPGIVRLYPASRGHRRDDDGEVVLERDRLAEEDLDALRASPSRRRSSDSGSYASRMSCAVRS